MSGSLSTGRRCNFQKFTLEAWHECQGYFTTSYLKSFHIPISYLPRSLYNSLTLRPPEICQSQNGTRSFPNHHFSGWRNLSCQCSVHPHDVEIQHLTCRCMMNGTGLRRIFATQKRHCSKKIYHTYGFLIQNRYFYKLGCCLQHFYHGTPQTKSIKKQRTSTCSTASQPR